jgi:hypothetical protein
MSNCVEDAGTDYGTMPSASGFNHQRTTERFFGDIKRTGINWVASLNYVSHYNWSIRNWEYLGGAKKRQMRGEPILLNRVILFLILVFTIHVCVQTYLGNARKYYLMTTLFIGVINTINTIWNWRVYAVNGNRIHPLMFYFPDSMLDSTNEFYEIPIHTRITDRRTLMIANQLGVLIGQLIQQYQSSTSVRIMVYGARYLKWISFPMESILVFFFSISAVLAACFFLITAPYY